MKIKLNCCRKLLSKLIVIVGAYRHSGKSLLFCSKYMRSTWCNQYLLPPGVFPVKFYILSSSETIQTNACNLSSMYSFRQPATALVDDVLECQILRREKGQFWYRDRPGLEWCILWGIISQTSQWHFLNLLRNL